MNHEAEYYGKKEEIPTGPTALSLDFAFASPDTQLFGLPDRIDDFEIKDTIGAKARDEEPYRLCNLDHFDDHYYKITNYA